MAAAAAEASGESSVATPAGGASRMNNDWLFIYPVYLNSKKTEAQGRKIPKERAAENPTTAEVAEICRYFNLSYEIEVCERLLLCFSLSCVDVAFVSKTRRTVATSLRGGG